MSDSQLPLPATAEDPKKKRVPLKWWPPSWSSDGSQGNTSTQADGSDSKPEPESKIVINISVADVLKAVRFHKSFQLPSVAPDVEVTDLPTFDDLTLYGVGEDEQERLWDLEARRLVGAVTADAHRPFCGSAELAVDSKSSYEAMAALADQVFQVLDIVEHDRESLLAEHESMLCTKNKIQRSLVGLNYLRDRYEEDEEHDPDSPCTNRQDLFHFIDYCTATLARLICTASEGEVFHVAVVASIVKLSTKLKVLSAHPGEYAKISIENGVSSQEVHVPQDSDMRGRQGDGIMPGFGASQGVGPGPGDSANSNLRALADLMRNINTGVLGQIAGGNQLATISRKDTVKMFYFFQGVAIHRNVTEMLFYLVVSLRGTNRMVRTALTSYEICALIYETGVERFRTLVFQDQNGDFFGTSHAAELNCAGGVIRMLSQIVEHIAAEDRSNQSRGGASAGSNHAGGHDNNADQDDTKSVGTEISWSYVPGDSGSRSLQLPQRLPLSSMSRVVAVIVPMILASPHLTHSIRDFMNMVTSTDLMQERKQEGKVKPRTFGNNYSAFFCMTTREYHDNQADRESDEAKSLSNSLMRRNNLLGGKDITTIGRNVSFGPLKATPVLDPVEDRDTKTALDRIQRHQTELDRARYKMSKWILEEKGVMVQCGVFVTSLMLVCAVLVTGGIAVGVTVGERIPGVDPFNITTYCWVMAGFLLLVAKSIRVHQWPWNDFLRGRVLCTSVSELSSVTGINGQLIIAHLLQEEANTFLQTRGPFNAVFRRRSDVGFSIDIPISMWTMLICGLIMIEVESADGRGLVCLDVRGRGVAFIENLGTIVPKKDGADRIYCRSLPDQKVRGADHHKAPHRVRLNVGGEMAWRRAIGFYGIREAEFV
ncbi:hypothetical protein RB595_005845 [Gaeumannomyces hyphopodioides]